MLRLLVIRVILVSLVGGAIIGCGSSDDQPREDSITHRLAYGEDASQYGWLTLPTRNEGSRTAEPIVVLIHGGFWQARSDGSLMFPIVDDLTDRGVATWNIEFRRIGNMGGGYPGTLEDVAAAIDYLSEIAEDFALDTSRVVVIGHSSGGHLALWSAGREALGTGEPGANPSIDPQLAVGLAAITDLELAARPGSITEKFLGGTPASVPDHYRLAAPRFDPTSMFLVHGELDRIVPLSSTARATDAGVPIRVVPNADHFDPIQPGNEAWQAVLDVVLPALAESAA